jgi:hypothetical protein
MKKTDGRTRTKLARPSTEMLSGPWEASSIKAELHLEQMLYLRGTVMTAAECQTSI